jgi:hypothetical protein
VLQAVPSFHEHLVGATIARLCSVSKDLRVTAIDFGTQVLLNQRPSRLGLPPYSDTTRVDPEVLPEGFPVARLPGLIAQSEVMLWQAALQISYGGYATAGLAVAHTPIRPVAEPEEDPIAYLPTVRMRCSMPPTPERGAMLLPLDLDALWWAEVEEEVRQGLRQTPVSSGGPFTRHDVLRVLALRAATKDRFETTRNGPSSYFGRLDCEGLIIASNHALGSPLSSPTH